MTAGAEHRAVGFQEAIQLFIKNFVNFEGRSSRGAFWWAYLAIVIGSIVASVIDGIIGIPLVGGLFSLAVIIPNIASGIRRLHDIDKSGTWLFIGLIPLVGAIILIIWFAQAGQRAANRFGPDVEAGR